ncbi:hypothetical protein [Nitrospirillum sp. BR 11163]|uniref:hypothetical protein n=1 Tax=Nitrospirillum sp. BR 11163 TaxID=3104323 RepID=UPI002AFEDBE0|nr:hypothetical protein [Nitrospirillum sp. BR 11163]MEA1672236.1 hypothetical protein [Nitrospirillum sp. BR 11163]
MRLSNLFMIKLTRTKQEHTLPFHQHGSMAMDGWQRRYRLSNGPGGLGVSCTAEGLTLAGVPLLAKGTGGFQPRPAAEVEKLLKRAYAGAELNTAMLQRLAKIADALNRGDLAQAMIRAVHLRLPDLDWDGAVRLAQANDNLAKYSPDQPRDEDGRWTDTNARDVSASIEPKPKEPQGVGPTMPNKTQVTPPGVRAPFRAATAVDFALPATPKDAPPVVNFADAFQQNIDTYWREGLAPLLNAHGRRPPDGQKEWVIEQGATVVARKDGVLELQNKGGLPRTAAEKSREFHPDLTVKDPENFTLLGTVHIHIYDDGLTDMSFSGGDAKTLMDNGINFSLVQSGEKQFLFIKTKETRRSESYERGGSGFVEGFQDNRVRQLAGRNTKLWPAASTQANIEAAKMYHLAYYEGRNGTLYRVYP